MSKRVWKLQDFVAHTGRVHCARLGEKSGQVLATGGDDKRVNIWKVGKPHAMMSLAGHSSAVECLVFDKNEEVLVVGCAGGSMQVWNLEYRKMAGTLTGHRTACNSVEFHPYGEFFASGSADTNLKIWDLRRKSCIQTYKGHTNSISSIRFSPHGRWVATGGQDNMVKIWDLTAGKLMRDLDLHKGPVTSVAFHPKEYLLATGSADRTTKLWSLETFSCVGSTDLGSSPVQAVKFYVEEHSVISASQDALRIYPTDNLSSPLDVIDADWKGLQDMRLCSPEEKLIAISSEGSQLGIWVADLQRRESAAVKGAAGYGRLHAARPKTQAATPASASAPLAGNSSASREAAARRGSDRIPPPNVGESGATPDRLSQVTESRAPGAGYKSEASEGRRPSSSPNGDAEETRARISEQPLQTYLSDDEPFNFDLARQEQPLTTSETSSQSMAQAAPHASPTQNGDSRINMRSGAAGRAAVSSGCAVDRYDDDLNNRPVDAVLSLDTREDREVLDPSERPRPRTGEVSSEVLVRAGSSGSDGPGHRTPSRPVAQQAQLPVAQASATMGQVMQQVQQQHQQMVGVLRRRASQVQRLKDIWTQGNLTGLRDLLKMPQDEAVFCDFVRSTMRTRHLIGTLNLDACQGLLPIVRDLLFSKYDDFVFSAFQFSELMLQNFRDVILDTRRSSQQMPERQLDLAREERLRKCNACFEIFREIQGKLAASHLASRLPGLHASLRTFLHPGSNG